MKFIGNNRIDYKTLIGRYYLIYSEGSNGYINIVKGNGKLSKTYSELINFSQYYDNFVILGSSDLLCSTFDNSYNANDCVFELEGIDELLYIFSLEV